jgi:hypothetical protein
MAVLGLFQGAGPARRDDYINRPSAYGSIPNIPETTTSKQVADWTSQLPNYAALSQQASDLAGTYMSGQVPSDVIRLLQQQAGERGIATGMPLSENANAAYLRALGLTSLDLQGRGMQSYTNLLQASPRTTTTTQEQSNNVLKAIYEAAPNPYAAAMANLQAMQMGRGSGAGAVGSAPRASAQPSSLLPTSGSSMFGYNNLGTAAPAYNPSPSYLQGLYDNLPTGNAISRAPGTATATAGPGSSYAGISPIDMSFLAPAETGYYSPYNAAYTTGALSNPSFLAPTYNNVMPDVPSYDYTGWDMEDTSYNPVTDQSVYEPLADYNWYG